MKEKIKIYLIKDLIGAVIILMLLFVIMGGLQHITNLTYISFLIAFIEFYFFKNAAFKVKKYFLSFLRKIALARIITIISLISLDVWAGISLINILSPKLIMILMVGFISSVLLYLLAIEWSNEFKELRVIGFASHRNLIFATIGITLFGLILVGFSNGVW